MASSTRFLSLLAATTLVASPAFANTLGGRLPNIEGTELPAQGHALFSFTHRLSVGPAPAYSVSAIPSFDLLGGLTNWLTLGLLYSTKTFTVANASQELELAARERFLNESEGAPLSLALKEAFNVTAMSPDAELTVAKQLGPVGLTGVVRGFGNYGYTGSPGGAAGLGLAWEFVPNVQLVGDAVYNPRATSANTPMVWGGGLRFQIPSSPHVLTLQVSNAATNTLQGASTPTGAIRYGFSFDAPFSPMDWFPSGTPAVAAKPVSGVSPMLADAISQGQTLFQNNCAACHGATGQGGFGPDLHDVGAKKGADYISLMILHGSPKGMPSFKSQLTAEQVAELAAFVKRL